MSMRDPMDMLRMLPSANPMTIPRVVHRELNVPVTRNPVIPMKTPSMPPTVASGRAPKTRMPIGMVVPILGGPGMM